MFTVKYLILEMHGTVLLLMLFYFFRFLEGAAVNVILTKQFLEAFTNVHWPLRKSKKRYVKTFICKCFMSDLDSVPRPPKAAILLKINWIGLIKCRFYFWIWSSKYFIKVVSSFWLHYFNVYTYSVTNGRKKNNNNLIWFDLLVLTSTFFSGKGTILMGGEDMAESRTSPSAFHRFNNIVISCTRLHLHQRRTHLLPWGPSLRRRADSRSC